MSVGGVPVLRFRPDPAQRQPDPRYYQQIKGLMNVTSPMAAGPSGSPSAAGPRLFLSLPGYCHADGQLAAGVDGVSCDPERHDVYMDVGESPLPLLYHWFPCHLLCLLTIA